MNKNNPINSVFLIALASVSLIAFIGSLYEALVFAVVIVAVFLVSVSIVSMIEKIADKHVKFLAFALISAGLITVLKLIFDYVNVKLIVLMADYIDIAIVPCLLMGIVPIYFEDSFSVKQFFSSALYMSLCSFLMITMYGALIEILGYGTIANYSLKFAGLEFFRQTYGGLIIIATLTIPFNMVRRACLKSQKRYLMLVERYKIQIREIRSSAQRQKQIEGGEQ